MRTLLGNAQTGLRAAVAVLAILLTSVALAPAAEDETVVFVCQHGVVNSQIAAAYFNKAAQERALPFRAVSRGIDLYRSVPVRVRDGLALDGLEAANTPQQLVVEDMAAAGRVVAFDEIPAEQRGGVNVTYWSGVPLGIDDYETTRDQIVQRIDALIPTLVAAAESAGNKAPLQLETKIPLGDVRGRIDHLAVDLKRQRLFVAELGNDSVGVVDLAANTVLKTITGLSEPQGVGYEPSTDTLYVANARDGSVRLYEANEYKATGRIELGSDADNIRIDAANKRVIVGYGNGGLAILDPATRSKVQSIPLKAHPEGFQLEPSSGRIFVNLPDARAVAVVDSASGKQIANWPMDKGGNFAMTIDRDRSRVLLAYRSPAVLAVFSTDGKPIASAEICGDVDDLFVDAKRERVYVSCGAGYIDVLEIDGSVYRRIARLPTATGARTSLFVPELDRLLVAVRAGPAGPAAIWAFKPMP
ncbi:YncE family protein [Bradyrhizobium sp. Gha]|uniref:YncE family protein n=1 Tax=Bradyrhizobium sp. Gha TaxID=1855318 RepID=UPI0008E1EBEA|nr:YncE family protein [Bradyrhizobium sp. Gha]SFH67102.1 40-residue YVTN family beta-propeller repeat-containing protein [Bradyrhizobium sp. Gha]